MLENSEDKDDKDKANILQKQFVSVFTHEQEGNIPELKSRTTERIPNVVITEEMVRNEILSLNVNKSCDPDDVHPLLVIELDDTISWLTILI